MQHISRDYLGDETRLVRAAADAARLDAVSAADVQRRAAELVLQVRAARSAQSGLDAFLLEYSLSSREGVLLLCLAESLLRIPDSATADKLIAEKIQEGDWASHAGDSESLFVNASTWSLMLTGRLLRSSDESTTDAGSLVQRLVMRMGEPVVRAAMAQAMRILGTQFVMGRNIDAALRRSRNEADTGSPMPWCYSFDMLGEAALTWADADRYQSAYAEAIGAIGAADAKLQPAQRSSISIKLSALHPRYEVAREAGVMAELGPRLLQLAQQAAALGVPLTVDAEETDRLELSLRLILHILEAPTLDGWEGFGLAVQAYQRRALSVVDWLVDQGARCRRRLNVRLVKGAYWDSEIKRTQERGLASYPVFTRKMNTDVSYLACARRMLLPDAIGIYPQFATHNAHTVAWVLQRAREGGRPFEFQRLHGMGRELYECLLQSEALPVTCRVYSPVGSHTDLLPYLVRRLLENGANTSFVNRIVDERLPVPEIVADPIAAVDALQEIPHAAIPVPSALFGKERRNSMGMNFADEEAMQQFYAAAEPYRTRHYKTAGVIGGKPVEGMLRTLVNPANREDVVGSVAECDASAAEGALRCAAASFTSWDATPAAERGAALRRAADLFELHSAELMLICVREAGKTLPDALAEVREAVDFLRYYAAEAERQFAKALPLPGPTGERNELSLRGRGPFVCISPWNFPLSIFTGQVAAALAAGNPVIAKPAEQTPLIAGRAVELLHAAGIPPDVLAFLPGDGEVLGKALLSDPRVAGVAFTGSTAVAQLINRQLAAREGPIGVLIAETGGQNVMFVDSSALPEQVVLEAVTSAFNSAGQRCSALRVLLVQEDIAERVITLLRGHMDTLTLGDPALLATDIGPVIDEESRQRLEAHVARLQPRARWTHRTVLPADVAARGRYFSPTAMEIASLDLLTGEVFGPVLHVLRYRAEDLDQWVDAVNALGFGLTLGIQTRIDATAQRIATRARVGNVYVNRNMIGAVVGVQPFGGCGLSGTGPKAGGPHYLQRFATERTLTTNTTAVGGNASLLTLDAGS